MRPHRTFLLTMAVLATFSGCKKSSTVEVTFAPRVPDPAKVAAQLEQDRKNLSDYDPSKAALVTIEFLEKFNLLTTSGERSQTKLNEAMEELKVAAKRCISDDGPEILHKLALHLLVRFEAALSELVAATKNSKTSTALLTGAEPPGEIAKPFQEFAKLGGDFLLHAANAGLARQSSKGGIEFIDGAPFFIRLAFKVRLANILPEATSPKSFLLSDFEREWYDIWVVERSRTATAGRKLQALKRIKKRDDSYPLHEAKGIILYQAKKYGPAAESFNQALREKPGDKRIKKFLKAAQNRAN